MNMNSINLLPKVGFAYVVAPGFNDKPEWMQVLKHKVVMKDNSPTIKFELMPVTFFNVKPKCIYEVYAKDIIIPESWITNTNPTFNINDFVLASTELADHIKTKNQIYSSSLFEATINKDFKSKDNCVSIVYSHSQTKNEAKVPCSYGFGQHRCPTVFKPKKLIDTQMFKNLQQTSMILNQSVQHTQRFVCEYPCAGVRGSMKLGTMCAQNIGPYAKNATHLSDVLIGTSKTKKRVKKNGVPQMKHVIKFDTSKLEKFINKPIIINRKNVKNISNIENIKTQTISNKITNNKNKTWIQKDETYDKVYDNGNNKSKGEDLNVRNMNIKHNNNNNNNNNKNHNINGLKYIFSKENSYFKLNLVIGNFEIIEFYAETNNGIPILITPIASRCHLPMFNNIDDSYLDIFMISIKNPDCKQECINGTCMHKDNDTKGFCPQKWITADFVNKKAFIPYIEHLINCKISEKDGQTLIEMLPKHMVFDGLINFEEKYSIVDIKNNDNSFCAETETMLSKELKKGSNNKKRLFFRNMRNDFETNINFGNGNVESFIKYLRNNRKIEGICFQINIGFNEFYIEPILMCKLNLNQKEYEFGYPLVRRQSKKTGKLYYKMSGILNDHIIHQNNLLLNTKKSNYNNNGYIEYSRRRNLCIKIDFENEETQQMDNNSNIVSCITTTNSIKNIDDSEYNNRIEIKESIDESEMKQDINEMKKKFEKTISTRNNAVVSQKSGTIINKVALDVNENEMDVEIEKNKNKNKKSKINKSELEVNS